MASSRNLKPTNALSNGPVLTYAKSNVLQIDNRLPTISENEALNRRMTILEELLSKENGQIKQLHDKIEKLEEQATLHKSQIQNLEEKIKNLQLHDLKGNGEESVISTHVKENTTNQTHAIIPKEEDNRSVLLPIEKLTSDMTAQIKPTDIFTYKIDINFKKQEHGTIIQSESEEVHAKNLHLLNSKGTNEVSTNLVTRNSDMKTGEINSGNKNKSETFNNEISCSMPKTATTNSVQLRPINSSQELHKVIMDQDASKFTESRRTMNESRNNKSTECSKDSSDKTKRWVGSGNYMFTSWMDSSERDFSLWGNARYRNSLLSYIGRVYGQKDCIRQVLAPLRLGFNNSGELDQLYMVIRELEKQDGAKKSLREWQIQTKPDHRLVEVKTMFEFNSACPSVLGDLKLSSPFDLDEIISRESINAYFDVICQNGLVTAEIGEYLHLSKENIFSGNQYDNHNERVTFVNVNLNESTIDLADNRVDLITCFVTLHHVPQLNKILAEIIRILRPGGYLILREHDCKKARSLKAKYLNFVHAFMMIAGVGEFSNVSIHHIRKTQGKSDAEFGCAPVDWGQQKSDIIKYTNSIQYRTRDEWQHELQQVGFRLRAELDYDGNNPQALFYAVYQLNAK